MTKPVVEPVLLTRASFCTSLLCKIEPAISTWRVRVFPVKVSTTLLKRL